MNNFRTLEVIAKYIGEKTGLRVHLQPDVTPHADPNTMEIWLPSNVTDEHIFPAIALAMHEAGHIKHTRYDSKQMAADDTDFGILNALEDARIDGKNFRLLPNIKSFYKELYVHLREKNKSLAAVLPPDPLALCDCIMRHEGFPAFTNKRADVQALADQIEPLFNDGVYYLDAGMYEQVKERIQMIRALLDASNQAPSQPGSEDSKDGSKPQDVKRGDQATSGQSAKDCGTGQDPTLSETLQKLTRDPSVISTDPSKVHYSPVDPLVMTESTRKRFEEMLKIKEERLVPTDSGVLNTENLAAFFTSDIEDLFTDIKINTPKRSRISLVLDASGSMSNPLWDGTPRHHVVKAAAKSIIRSIETVNQSEGLCVDWEIAGFEMGLIPMKKETWEIQYYPRGGTNIVGTFQEAQDRLIKDLEVTGNKIIIFITDGEVKSSAVEVLNELILRNNSQIKLVIVAVGADPAGIFCKRVVDGRNILDASMADQVLFEAISLCLD